MKKSELINNIFQKKSFLCIGLDTTLEKIPPFLKKYEYPLFEFNKRIIESTKDLCIAYKINTAFYEAQGTKGWKELEKTAEILPKSHFRIADAKRGDVGNTSEQYCKAFFEIMGFDAITVSPYMGYDSIRPFLEYEDKWVIILTLTSNKGVLDFQTLPIEFTNKKLYEKVLERSSKWGSSEQIMYVAGATQASSLSRIRSLVPENFILVPGIGAQRGDLDKVVQNGMNDECGLIVNSSRNIIYASNKENFDQLAKEKAKEIQKKMENVLNEK